MTLSSLRTQMNFPSLFRSLAYFSIAYFIKKKWKPLLILRWFLILIRWHFRFHCCPCDGEVRAVGWIFTWSPQFCNFFSILVLRHSELPCKTICGQEQRRPKLATIFKNKKFQSWPYLDKVTFSICVFFKFSLLPRTKCSKESIKSLLGFFPSRPYTAC